MFKVSSVSQSLLPRLFEGKVVFWYLPSWGTNGDGLSLERQRLWASPGSGRQWKGQLGEGEPQRSSPFLEQAQPLKGLHLQQLLQGASTRIYALNSAPLHWAQVGFLS